MCLATCYWARISRLVYAANSHDVAVNGFEDLQFYRELSFPNGERRLLAEVAVDGELRQRAAGALTEWADKLPALLPGLTDGLPFPVHHPAGLVRKRLVAKLPPELPPARAAAPARRVIECGTCGKDVPPERLVGGDCGVCRGEPAPAAPGAALPPERVHASAAHVRAGVRNAEQQGEPAEPAPV